MRRLLTCALLGAVLAGCAGGGQTQTAPTPAAPQPVTTPAAPAPATTSAAPVPAPAPAATAASAPSPAATPPPQGCAPGPDDATFDPQGAAGPLTGDVDGDRLPDQVYVEGLGAADRLPRLVVRTAAGAVRRLEIEARRPQDAGVYGVVDADDDGREEIFVRSSTVPSTGVSSIPVVWLAVLEDCDLVFVENAEGKPYAFLVGPDEQGARAGVGCVDVDGDDALDLVGLSLTPRDGGHTYTRTVVEIDGASASNGATDTGSSDQPIPPEVSCSVHAFADGLLPAG